MKPGSLSRRMGLADPRQPRRADAVVPLLLVKNGQACVKMVPYFALRRAMSKIRQSMGTIGSPAINPDLPVRENGIIQMCSIGECDKPTTAKSSEDLGLRISEVKSISKGDFEAMRIAFKPVGEILEGKDVENAIVNRVAPESAGSLETGLPEEPRIKIKLTRQHNNAQHGKFSWRVVGISVKSEVQETGFPNFDRAVGEMEPGEDGQMRDCPQICSERQQRPSQLCENRKRSLLDCGDVWLRCRPYEENTETETDRTGERCTGNYTEERNLPLRSAGTGTPQSISQKCDDSCLPPIDDTQLSQTTALMQEKYSSKDRRSDINLDWMPASIAGSPTSRDECRDFSDDDCESVPDTNPPTPRSDTACKRRRLSASSSGDFHHPFPSSEAAPCNGSSSDDETSSLSSCDLPAFPWLSAKPESKSTPQGSDSAESTPSWPWIRGCDATRGPPVFHTSREERIYHLKRELAERFRDLSDLTSGSGDTAGNY